MGGLLIVKTELKAPVLSSSGNNIFSGVRLLIPPPRDLPLREGGNPLPIKVKGKDQPCCYHRVGAECPPLKKMQGEMNAFNFSGEQQMLLSVQCGFVILFY
jgi:hypothetical protein